MSSLTMRKYLIWGNLCVILITLVFFGTAIASGPKPPVLVIENPESRLSSMYRNTASVFMEIVNTGGEDELLSASTTLPNSVVELHDVKDGRMFKVNSVKIPAHSKVTLKPGSLHIMVFKLPEEIKDGSSFDLTLSFAKSGAKTLKVMIGKTKDTMKH